MTAFFFQRFLSAMIFCLLCFPLKAGVIDTLPPELHLIGDTLCPGGSFQEAVRVKDFIEIRSFQFQLRWNPQAIQLDSVWPAPSMEDGIFINDQQRNEGKVNAVWFNPVLLQGLSLPDEDPVLFLRYSAAGQQNVASDVYFDTTDQSFPFLFSQIKNDSTHTVKGVGIGDRISFSAPVLSDTNIIATTAGQSNGRIEIVIAGGNPPYRITWSNNDTGPDISELPAGNYFCTVTDENDCSNQFGPFVVEQTTATKDAELRNDIFIYPNPFQESIAIKSSIVIQKLEILNLQGQTIILNEDHFMVQSFYLQKNDLVPGCYWLKITDQRGNIFCKRIVKM